MFGLNKRIWDENLAHAIAIDFLPELSFATRLKERWDGGIVDGDGKILAIKCFDILRGRYRQDEPCPSPESYRRASKSLREIYDSIHQRMLDILYA